MPFDRDLALALECRSIDRAVAGQVIEERQHEAERLRRRKASHRPQPHAQAAHAGREQGFLVVEMRVEGRPADAGAVDDVLRGQAFEAAFGHQAGQGVQQQVAAAGGAAIEGRFHGHGRG